MTKEKALTSLRPLISGAASAGLAATLSSLPMAAHAQSAGEQKKAQAEGDSTSLEAIVVTGGEKSENTNNAVTSSSRLPGTVKDIPQIVNTVSEKLITEQNVTTLEQALRNVPGITVAIGEANGGPNGDRFRIRGFEAIGDSYRDGLRDFGVYVRDSFNLEQVQVLKGPSGESFGVGTTGGAISTTSKTARLGTFGSADVSVGNGPLVRSTIDYNKQLDETTAIRVNAMGNRQDIADRDHVESDRWGVAGSIGFGIGTDTSWYLDYMHQSNDRTPDYGVPMAAFTPTGAGVREPITEFGVPRSNFYGKETDRDRSDVDMLTSRFSTEANDWLTIKNDTRLVRYGRYFSTTPTICGDTELKCSAVGSALYNGAVNPVLSIGAGGGPTYDQTAWGIQNVTTGIAEFETGALRHQAVFGLDLSYQHDERQGYRYLTPKNPSTVWEPDYSYSRDLIVENPNNVKESNSRNAALFASDRMWLTEQFSILGGVRWDYYKAHYDLIAASGRTVTDANTSFFSPKLSAIWEPTKDQSYYVSYAISKNVPWGQYIASDVNAVATDNRANLDPETSSTIEAGAKLDLLDGRLGLTGAVFQVTKDNSYYTNASNNLVPTGEKQRVRGIELGATGKLTEQWDVYASYTLLNSEILDASAAATIGNPVAGVPRNSGSLWTTYDLAPHFDALDGELLIGAGVTYRDGMYIRSDEKAKIPYSLSLDAMVSYKTGNWNVSLNAYNLADRINYDSFFQGENQNTARAIPSSGRTFILKVGTTF
ncbi:TonB-dependent receptor [Shinella zoogloeoides]|uniref:TonB-dependent receptor n=1 Tax=Shinella zoogloeoides TaxID=352475 RepID=UPI0028A948F4|nr:TonB-dependent receptor [Shinella zoogloeoides]